MLEPVRAAGARREQRDGGIGAVRRQALQRVLPSVEERAQRADLRAAKGFRHHPGEHAAVLPRDGDAGRAGGAIRQHHPMSVWPADQIGGVEFHPLGPGRPADAGAAGAQKPGIWIDQGGRQHTVRQQRLPAIKIGQQRRQQRRTLRQAGRELLELAGKQRQRNRIAPPGKPLDARQDRGDALVLERAIDPAHRLLQATFAQRRERAEQAAPMRAQPTTPIHHLVEANLESHAPSVQSRSDRQHRSMQRRGLGG